jgi:uncharacterized protein VirK/YbjX
MVLNATFSSIFQLYRGSLFYWWSKPEYPKFSYITVLYNTNFVEFNFFLNTANSNCTSMFSTCETS